MRNLTIIALLCFSAISVQAEEGSILNLQNAIRKASTHGQVNKGTVRYQILLQMKESLARSPEFNEYNAISKDIDRDQRAARSILAGSKKDTDTVEAFESAKRQMQRVGDNPSQEAIEKYETAKRRLELSRTKINDLQREIKESMRAREGLKDLNHMAEMRTNEVMDDIKKAYGKNVDFEKLVAKHGGNLDKYKAARGAKIKKILTRGLGGVVITTALVGGTIYFSFDEGEAERKSVKPTSLSVSDKSPSLDSEDLFETSSDETSTQETEKVANK